MFFNSWGNTQLNAGRNSKMKTTTQMAVLPMFTFLSVDFYLTSSDHRRRIDRLTEKCLTNIYNKDQSKKYSEWSVCTSCLPYRPSGDNTAGKYISHYEGSSYGGGPPPRAAESKGRQNKYFKQRNYFPPSTPFKMPRKMKGTPIQRITIFSATHNTLFCECLFSGSQVRQHVQVFIRPLYKNMNAYRN
jgi:hypothetical protein